MPSEPEPILYDVTTAARVLALGKDKLYELVARDEVPYVRLGERSIRFPRQLLEAWIESRTRGSRS